MSRRGNPGAGGRLGCDERGATLVEFALAIALFLLIFFGTLDFGRMAWNWVMAEKAVQTAARIAAVRPPACPGVPERNQIGASTTAVYGLPCSTSATYCQGLPSTALDTATQNVVTCTGGADIPPTNPTVLEIWTKVSPLLPRNATPSNLRFAYSYPKSTSFSQRMGFLGGPFVPVVTVELLDLPFEFITPLDGLARLAGAAPTSAGNTPAPFMMPALSVSLPGEDLALGTNG